MAFGSTARRMGDSWATIAVIADEDGVARHPVIARLTSPGALQRDLADAVHSLCAVHGRVTDLFADARLGERADADTIWLDQATGAFAVERAYLARLTAAAGPLPSTPGQAETDAAFAAQRHAFDILARSDRAGCAIGAAVAILMDWHSFRRILDTTAVRVGLEPPQGTLPDEHQLAAIVATLGDVPAIQRAMTFGAQQVFAQHRGLCDLIEARASARNRQ